MCEVSRLSSPDEREFNVERILQLRIMLERKLSAALTQAGYEQMCSVTTVEYAVAEGDEDANTHLNMFVCLLKRAYLCMSNWSFSS